MRSSGVVPSRCGRSLRNRLAATPSRTISWVKYSIATARSRSETVTVRLRTGIVMGHSSIADRIECAPRHRIALVLVVALDVLGPHPDVLDELVTVAEDERR